MLDRVEGGPAGGELGTGVLKDAAAVPFLPSINSGGTTPVRLISASCSDRIISNTPGEISGGSLNSSAITSSLAAALPAALVRSYLESVQALAQEWGSGRAMRPAYFRPTGLAQQRHKPRIRTQDCSRCGWQALASRELTLSSRCADLPGIALYRFALLLPWLRPFRLKGLDLAWGWLGRGLRERDRGG